MCLLNCDSPAKKKTENPVTDPKGSYPTQLSVKVTIKPEEVPEGWPTPKANMHDMSKYPKHIMMISRGTQGDVQPFMAMARGLAEEKGWMVTFVTEQHFKPFVMRNAKVQLRNFFSLLTYKGK